MQRLALLVLVAVHGDSLAHPIQIELPDRRFDDAAESSGPLISAIRARDARAIASQLRAPLDHGALWFPDAGCTKQFGKRGSVDAKALDAFARCVATLELIATTRASSMPSDLVLTYKPGVEVEVGYWRGKVYSFGRDHSVDDATPMLTAQAFEALRKTGTTNLDAVVAAKLEREVAQHGSVSAWIRTCLDAKGAITSTGAPATTAGDVVFRAAIADWSFRPFEYRGTAIAACSQSLLTYPAAKAPPIETLPAQVNMTPSDPDELDSELDDVIELELGPTPATITQTTLEGLRISGTRSITPDPLTTKEIVKAGKLRVLGSFKVCINVAGLVTSVGALSSTGYARYDAKLRTEMLGWKFRPYLVNRKPTAACTAETFIFKP